MKMCAASDEDAAAQDDGMRISMSAVDVGMCREIERNWKRRHSFVGAGVELRGWQRSMSIGV